MEKEIQTEIFDIENSPIKEAYKILGANNPKELQFLYGAEDQKLMKSSEWDYNNPELNINIVKNIIEDVDLNKLTEGEKEWRMEILWFWYHHATSCAIWRYKNKERALFFVRRALEYKTVDNPNKITQLLFFLINDQVKEAEELILTIDDSVEKESAKSVIEEYKEAGFFN